MGTLINTTLLIYLSVYLVSRQLNMLPILPGEKNIGQPTQIIIYFWLNANFVIRFVDLDENGANLFFLYILFLLSTYKISFRRSPKREDKGGTIITLKIKQKEGKSKSFFKKISLKDEQLESKIIQQSKCKSAFKGCTSVIRDSANTTWNEADSVKFHLTRANQRALL